MAFKLPGVQVDEGIRIERKLLARDQQVGLNLPAQAVQRDAQVHARLFLRPLRPQQFGEFIAPQRPVLAGEVDQQRLHGVGRKVDGLRSVAQRDGQRAKGANG